MRTWYLPTAGLLSFMLVGGAAALAGCDDITAGQPQEDSGPPKITKVIVQDDGTLNFAVDLLNKAPAAPCADDKPCTAGGLGYPAPACSNGLCPDPLSSACSTPNNGDYFGTPFGPPYDSCATGDVDRPVYISPGGSEFIRVVFSKRLCPTIETVTVDPMTGNAMYKLANDLIEVLGPDGKPLAIDAGGPRVPQGAYYDPTGTADATSDPVGEPFGPALVFVPAATLDANTKYTIKLDLANIVDCNKQAAQGMDTYTFTTENIQTRASNPDFSAPVEIKPDDVLTFNFNVGVNAESFDGMKVTPGTGTFAIDCGAMKFMAEGWLDQGSDATACAGNDAQLDVVAVSAPGVPVDLPDGASCTLTITGLKDDGLANGSLTTTFMFTVKGPVDHGHDADGNPNDPQSIHATVETKSDAGVVDAPVWVMPEQCGMAPAMGDMAMPAADMSSAVDGGTTD